MYVCIYIYIYICSWFSALARETAPRSPTSQPQRPSSSSVGSGMVSSPSASACTLPRPSGRQWNCSSLCLFHRQFFASSLMSSSTGSGGGGGGGGGGSKHVARRGTSSSSRSARCRAMDEN